MAGSDPRFNSAQFREGITFAMTMAKPNAVDDVTTFYRETDGVYARTDPGGKPYHWDDTPLANPTTEEVVVDSVVEYIPRTAMADVTALGEFNVSRAEVTVFSEGLAEIRAIRANYVKIGGNTYRISSVSPPFALFDVEFNTIFAEALDES